MFYLKYRPAKFAEVIGLDTVIKTLRKLLSQKPFPHAFLFTGPRGSGKTTTARLLAKAVNCENLSSSEAGIDVCDECSKCRAIAEGHFLDLIEIDAASNRGIDDIRSLKERVNLSPTFGKFKVYIVDEAHMLTIEAFNALLKTLEEPPAHAIFVLATTEAHKIPETVRSRCHVFDFKRATEQSLLSKLKFILQSEGAAADPSNLTEIVRLAQGGFRDAETMLEQLLSGFSDFKNRDLAPSRFLDLIAAANLRESLGFISEAYRAGLSLSVFVQNLLYYLRDLLLVKSGVNADSLSVSAEVFDKLLSQSAVFDYEEIQKMMAAFIKANQDFKVVPIPQLPLEMAVVRILEERRSEDEPGSAEKGTVREDSDSRASERTSRLPEVEEDVPAAGSKGPGSEESVRLAEPSQLAEQEDQAGESGFDSNSSQISLEEVLARWSQILSEVKPENHSLEALLRSTRPKEVTAEAVVLEVFYKFHKDKLGVRSSLDILEKVFSRVFSRKISVRCVLGEGKLDREKEKKVTERQESEEIKAAALSAFGG